MSLAAKRIAEACRGIVRRSDEIVTLAATPGAKLSRIFSRKEIAITNRICCELALAVADSESVADLVANIPHRTDICYNTSMLFSIIDSAGVRRIKAVIGNLS